MALARRLAGRPRAAPAPSVRLLAWSRGVFVALILAFALARVAGVGLPMSVQAVVYVGLMGTVSLWHGGFEHVANLRGRGETFQARYLVAYVALIAVAVGTYLVAPAAGLTVAIGVTVLKGGYGGLAVRRQATGTPRLDGPRGRAVGALARGGAVMIVPYLVWPGVFSAVSASMVGRFDPAGASAIVAAFDPTVRGAVGGWYAGLVVGYLAYCARRGWRGELLEVGLLVAYFAVVPPVVAVGVYFPCWYTARQVARLTAGGEVGSLGAAVRRVLRGGALPWLGAVAVLAALAWWLPLGRPTPTEAVALYSVFVAAIALPHVVVGSWLDRRQGIWSVA